MLGSNGAGKSTLNRTISGVMRPWRGAIRFRGRGDRARAAGGDRRARPHPRAGGPAHFPQHDGARKSRSRRLPPRPRAARAQPQPGVLDLSAARRTAAPARRHAVRRRAADAGDRPRTDGRAEAPDPRRAVARALAAPGRGAVRADQGASTRRASPCCWSSRTWCRASRWRERAYILDNGMFVLEGSAADIRNDPNLKRAYLGM